MPRVPVTGRQSSNMNGAGASRTVLHIEFNPLAEVQFAHFGLSKAGAVVEHFTESLAKMNPQFCFLKSSVTDPASP